MQCRPFGVLDVLIGWLCELFHSLSLPFSIVVFSKAFGLHLIFQGEDRCLINTKLLSISNEHCCFLLLYVPNSKRWKIFPLKPFYISSILLILLFSKLNGNLYCLFHSCLFQNIIVKEHETRQRFWIVSKIK